MAKSKPTAEPQNPASGSADETTRRAGRPPGSPNRDYVTGTRKPGECPKCGCTDSNDERKDAIPTPADPDYTHVELIRCKCANPECGQWRIDRQKCNPVI